MARKARLLAAVTTAAVVAGAGVTAVWQGSTATAAASGCAVITGNVVANCGFESGDLSGWTHDSGQATSGSGVVGDDAPHSGTYEYDDGSVSGPDLLSQVLPVSPGETYEVSFASENLDPGAAGESFLVTVSGPAGTGGSQQTVFTDDGTTIGDRYGQYSGDFDVPAGASTTATLTFSIRNDPSFYRIDDVSVVPVAASTSAPTPTSTPTPTATPTSGCTVSAMLVSSCGVWWGAYKHPGDSEDWSSVVTNLEAASNGQFGIVYRYRDFSGGLFPDSADEQLAASGHILLEDWASRIFSAGTHLQWSDIAAGKYDASVIDPEAEYLKAYGKPVMLSFDHEMDTRVGTSGQPADYVAAYRHIHDVFATLGVTNVIWVWTITGYLGHDSEFQSLYPGSSYVDWVGYDPYNFASCHSEGWKDFDQTIDPAYQWLEANGFGDKPFILPEYGTVSDPVLPAPRRTGTPRSRRF